MYICHKCADLDLVMRMIIFQPLSHCVLQFLQASSDGNATVSILSFRPRMEHIHETLSCRATNPLIPDIVLEDSMDLHIDCK